MRPFTAALMILISGGLFAVACSSGSPSDDTDSSESPSDSTSTLAPPETPSSTPGPTPDFSATQESRAAESVAMLTATAAEAIARQTATAVSQYNEAVGHALQVEHLKSNPPVGAFDEFGFTAGVVVDHFEYRRTVGYKYANADSKFIVFCAGIVAIQDELFVSPGQFQLVNQNGSTLDYDSSTFSFDNSFPSLVLSEGNNTGGCLSFLTLQDFVPAAVEWRGFDETITVTILE